MHLNPPFAIAATLLLVSTVSATQLDSESTTMTTSSLKTYISVKPHVMLELNSNSTLQDSGDVIENSTGGKSGSHGSGSGSDSGSGSRSGSGSASGSSSGDDVTSSSTFKKTGSSSSNSNNNETEEAEPAQTTAAAAATESKKGSASTLQFSIALAGIFAVFSLLM